jgi:hypothetical protein
MAVNQKQANKIPVLAKVTWIGDLPSIRHRCPKTEHVYLFLRNVPIQLTDPEDIQFYASKSKWKVEILEYATKNSKKAQQAATTKNIHDRGE